MNVFGNISHIPDMPGLSHVSCNALPTLLVAHNEPVFMGMIQQPLRLCRILQKRTAGVLQVESQASLCSENPGLAEKVSAASCPLEAT